MKHAAPGVRKIDRIETAITILQHLASAGTPQGVTEISRALKVDKVSIYRVLSSLEKAGWAAQNADSRKYKLGSRLFQFSLFSISQMEIQKASLPLLYELSHISGESAQLSLRTGLERMFSQEVPGINEIRLRITIGERQALWAGATGRCMLAFLKPGEIEEVIGLMKRAEKENQIRVSIQEKDLRDELQGIRGKGFAISARELQPDICALASPIFDASGLVIGAVSIRGLVTRFNEQTAEMYSSVIADTAKKISRTLAFPAES